MAEYIRRDIAIAEIQRFANPDEYEIVTAEEIYETAIAAVDCAPAASVKEVVRGKWIKEPDGGHRCSVCEWSIKSILTKHSGWRASAYDFCPNCGADLRGDAG